MSYAQGTTVPVERSKAEIEKTLTKYGADQFSAGWTKDKAVMLFRLKSRYIRIDMPLPTRNDRMSGTAGPFQPWAGSDDKLSAETRRRWRAMVLYVKAKLESVESGIVSFEQAFMAHVVLPNKMTVGEFMHPQIESAYKDGKMPPQLPGW